jgi:hypothetical protein
LLPPIEFFIARSPISFDARAMSLQQATALRQTRRSLGLFPPVWIPLPGLSSSKCTD